MTACDGRGEPRRNDRIIRTACAVLVDIRSVYVNSAERETYRGVLFERRAVHRNFKLDKVSLVGSTETRHIKFVILAYRRTHRLARSIARACTGSSAVLLDNIRVAVLRGNGVILRVYSIRLR